ncbi:MAG TPA: hypothetical protein VEB61_00250 [Candidatus Binatia bacterium]|nr:hypothetical protein [Candidatus Binatia bacterium]
MREIIRICDCYTRAGGAFGAKRDAAGRIAEKAVRDIVLVRPQSELARRRKGEKRLERWNGGIVKKKMEKWNHGMMFEYCRTPLFQSLNIPFFHYSNIIVAEQRHWLFSRRADFWLACSGASAGLLASVFLIYLHGDRELDTLDFVLSEFHLGATYDAVIRRRLWRHRRMDVVLIPLVILALTYAFSMSGQAILLTSIAMYAAVWHRGRQSLGVARFYQRQVGGPVSRTHEVLFRGAIYLPMLAGMLAYTHFSPMEYEGEPYFPLDLGAEITSAAGLAAVLWVVAYLAWTLRRNRGASQFAAWQNVPILVHPGEWWVVLAHAVAFGSGYLLGASNASFLLVLAVHHEVQYLYFTYAMARRSASSHEKSKGAVNAPAQLPDAKASSETGGEFRTEFVHAASFAVWPVIGFVGAIIGGWLQLEWLAPLGMGGLFCHYWLDGRIWTPRSFHN